VEGENINSVPRRAFAEISLKLNASRAYMMRTSLYRIYRLSASRLRIHLHWNYSSRTL